MVKVAQLPLLAKQGHGITSSTTFDPKQSPQAKLTRVPVLGPHFLLASRFGANLLNTWLRAQTV